MRGPAIVLRADGDSTLGLGHIARSLALADMLAPEHTLAFHTRCRLPSLERVIAQKAQLVTWDERVPLDDEAERFAAGLSTDEIVVLDGPHFDLPYQEAIKRRGCRLVCIDDLHDRRFVADLVLNHAGGLRPQDFDASASTRFYLGPAYALLRTEFLAAARARQRRAASDDVLVCLGGSDPKNDLLAVLERAAGLLPRARFQIVLGAGYRHLSVLEPWLERGGVPFALHRDLSAIQMVALMERCPTAITAPSTVSYEYAGIGGRLFLHQIADNQKYIRAHLVSRGLAFDLADTLPDAAAVERALAEQAAVFDGRSHERVCAAFRALEGLG